MHARTDDLRIREIRELVTHAAPLWAPRFSPDGRELAFSRMEADGLWHIWTVPAEGGAPRQVTAGKVPEIYASYSPDGSSIVFGCDGKVCRMNADGSDVVELFQAPGVELNHFDWGPPTARG